MKVRPSSLQSFLIIFKNFIHHHWICWKLISFVFFLCFEFFCEFEFFFSIFPFNSIIFLYIFKVWHDTTCGFWCPHLILLVLCFLIFFFSWICFLILSFYNLIHGVWWLLFFLVFFLLYRVINIFFHSLEYNYNILASFLLAAKKLIRSARNCRTSI